MILYRQQSSIKGATQLPSIVAKLLQVTLEISGYDSWMDKKDLSVDSQGLKDTIDLQMGRMKMAILCMGVGDLQRCSDEEDFFRWEIDRARELEECGVLQVVVIVHGTQDVVDLICGTSMRVKQRESALEGVGVWGEGLLEYLRTHFVIFLDIDTLDKTVEKIIARFNETG
jgi:hypothetical protein